MLIYIDYESISHLKRFLTYTFLQQRACAGKKAAVEAFVNAMKVVMLEVPKQRNVDDSGAHVMKNIELLLLWGSVQHFSETVYSQELITPYRQHWVTKFDELAELMPVKEISRSLRKTTRRGKVQANQPLAHLSSECSSQERKSKPVKRKFSEHQQVSRIKKLMKAYVKKHPGFVLVEVFKDGNCATRAALRTAGIMDNDVNVRLYKQLVVQMMRRNPSRYREMIVYYVIESAQSKTEAEIDAIIEQYLTALEEWGAYYSRVEIQALADVLKMPILFVCFVACKEVS